LDLGWFRTAAVLEKVRGLPESFLDEYFVTDDEATKAALLTLVNGEGRIIATTIAVGCFSFATLITLPLSTFPDPNMFTYATVALFGAVSAVVAFAVVQ
jgi:hypothetical protein